MMRIPFPHPAAMFSPPGSRPMFSPAEVLPSLGTVAAAHASLNTQPGGTAPESLDSK